MAVLLAGLPCHRARHDREPPVGSGMEAVAQASRAVLVGDAGLVVAGGVESMSRAPWVTLDPDGSGLVAVPGVDLVADDCVRRDTSPEALRRLAPAFRPDGATVTAGNAPPLADAAALLLAGEAVVASSGRRPLARIAARPPARSSLSSTASPLSRRQAGRWPPPVSDGRTWWPSS